MIRKSLPIILSCAMLVFVALTPLWLANKAVQTSLHAGSMRAAGHGVSKKFRRLPIPEISYKLPQPVIPPAFESGQNPQWPPKEVKSSPSPVQPITPPVIVPPVIKPPISWPVPIDPPEPVCPPCRVYEPNMSSSTSLILCPMDSSMRYLCAY
ncbi:MAG: hypothetical protein KIH63_002290 [Candidatus Saccharibacteria bacterium]|nr:hypothetical protein [Candidatus Saccharibacteria bacterium]